ncbi:MAG: 2-amino-4-hydroxy-6-hydroxymethyldihydropteridine diphosphokinase [Gemmatimonadota bacterium]
MSIWYVGVGSNIRPKRNIRLAARLLIGHPLIRLTGSSTFYRTEAVGAPGAPDFLNGVFELRTEMPHADLEDALAVIETASGRQRSEHGYAPRTLDLDILVWRAEPSDAWQPEGGSGPQHRDVRERAFVAVPLYEVAGDIRLEPDGSALGHVAASFAPGWGSAQRLFSHRIRRLLTASGEAICTLDACPKPD